MPNATKPHEAPESQTRPSTAPDGREAGTSRPAVGRKLDTPPIAQTPRDRGPKWVRE